MYCPNCTAVVSANATECKRCKALFGPGTAWRPVEERPSAEHRDAPGMPATLDNVMLALPLFAFWGPAFVFVTSGLHPFALVGAFLGVPIGIVVGAIYAFLSAGAVTLGRGTVEVRSGLGLLFGVCAAMVVLLAGQILWGSRPVSDGGFFMWAGAGGFSGFMTGHFAPVGRMHASDSKTRANDV